MIFTNLVFPLEEFFPLRRGLGQGFISEANCLAKAKMPISSGVFDLLAACRFAATVNGLWIQRMVTTL
jgi:hypothetical protein